MRWVVLLGSLAALAACGDVTANDPFPIDVDRASGAFVVKLRAGADEEPRTTVVDVLSPLTILDQDSSFAPRRHEVTLNLLEPAAAADPDPTVRARWCSNVLYMHPCDPDSACTIGAAGQPVDIEAVLGADILRSNAITFEPASNQMFILPDVAGDNEARGDACEVVVPAPFYGGGTLRIGDTEIGFAGTRIALGVCLSPDPAAADVKDRGTDAALVLSTGIGLSILGESRYRAWAEASGGPALETLPPATARLPSGPVDGRLGRIDRLAIVGTSTAPRGACREVFAHHLLTARDCIATDGDDCPCSEGNSCPVAAIAELAPTEPVEVVVVPDEHPLLQALRAELRPEQPEIDGILGVNALATTSFDVDYPNNRLLLRCERAGCVARPALLDNKRPVIEACVAAAPTVP